MDIITNNGHKLFIKGHKLLMNGHKLLLNYIHAYRILWLLPGKGGNVEFNNVEN